MFNNRVIILNGDEVISDTIKDSTWAEIKKLRSIYFKKTDLWYLKDRWDNLSTIKKGELNSFRQALRDLPQNYATANEAADNFPSVPEWII
jgi:hypothetical protein